jgi:L,D-transpeptidase ErfK/SrfK
MRCGRYLVLLLALFCASPVRATGLGPARALSGSESRYVVQNGDSFASIGSRFGVEASVLAQFDGLSPKTRLQPASTIWVDNRHIVPDGIRDGILINIPQRMLFFFDSGVLTAAYPVALGQPAWRTPQGDFIVVETRADPIWTVPKSIQREMARQGKKEDQGRTRSRQSAWRILDWAEHARTWDSWDHSTAEHISFSQPWMHQATSE